MAGLPQVHRVYETKQDVHMHVHNHMCIQTVLATTVWKYFSAIVYMFLIYSNNHKTCIICSDTTFNCSWMWCHCMIQVSLHDSSCAVNHMCLPDVVDCKTWIMQWNLNDAVTPHSTVEADTCGWLLIINVWLIMCAYQWGQKACSGGHSPHSGNTPRGSPCP